MTETHTDPRAEAAVLGAALCSADALVEALDRLVPEDFSDRRHREVFAAIVRVDAAGSAVDPVTVAADLRRHRRLAAVGGEAFLAALVEAGTGGTGVADWARVVTDRALLRGLADAGMRIARSTTVTGVDAAEALAAAEAEIFALGRPRGGHDLRAMTAVMADTLKHMAEVSTRSLIGASTGFAELDRMTGGLLPGQLVVVAARPGAGKSALALSMARALAEHTGAAVPFLSYEMSEIELAQRLLAEALRMDLLALRNGDIPPAAERDLAVAAERLAALPLWIDDNPPETIAGVRSLMRRLARCKRIGAVVVDYLQLMGTDRRLDNRNLEVSEISRGLKRLATELQVPVVACAQLNRQLENRHDKRPMLADLRDSGAIEQDANLVLMLYREKLYNAAAPDHEAELIIAKQRNGPTGTIALRWHGPSASYADGPRGGWPRRDGGGRDGAF